ncbi:tetratricopeptide (TPR) repeat protein [Epilithonimonas hungarica]|uniref:hypothetical protein n=1 Tax=Epilithonimonas hungarica TaxID=454006 RepID=UPI0012CF6690|nr:hypothetical protein [Epilithonimonas hungarica]MDP9955630.1 tetratricopeptide (TPR) repeat protein [Epilithonimonas hungarica]MPT31132.1 hypothetical protein [Chryseobacterium sp.]
MNKQKFIDKFLAAFLILAIIKIISVLAQVIKESFWAVIGSLFLVIVVVFILSLVVAALKSKENNWGNSGRRNSRGGSAYVEGSLFNRLLNKYEELAQKYIDEKNYIKAAKVYMNLLKDNYRGAKTLENAGLYNEAAVIYLKKLSNKSDAANCYEKAKQYRKAIDLHKELGNKEKVGDLYKEINDIKNSNTYYQMVVDDYTNNSQMVKASLIYRKKMEMPDEAQSILLKGWEEDRDGFNCLNNYFANIFDVKTLDQKIQELYQDLASEKKMNYLKAIKIEFNKDPKLQETTRNIAYEIIAEKVNAHSEIVNELKFFNPNDEIILKDISRYKTGRNKMFRN